MHKDDEMTPKERMEAYVTGKPMDRCPVLLFTGTVSAKFAGMTQRQRRMSSQNMADAQISTYKKLGHDTISISYGLHGMGFAIGSKYNDPEDAIPAVIEHVLKDINSLGDLDYEKALPNNDERLIKAFNACEIIQDEIGDECNVGFGLTGPFTSAASIYKIDDLLRGIKKNPQKLHNLLRKCTNIIKEIAKEANKRGLGLSIADPVASGTILRPEHYNEFVYPYTKEIVECIHGMNKAVSYHVCGQTSNILENMIDTGVDIMSLDNVVDIKYAKSVIGSKVCIAGNVDPVEIIMLGSKDQIENAVKQNYKDMYDSPKGYLLASGCDIPSGVPLENLDIFMAAARRFGKWPININILNK